ncbi:MAG: AAA family ATPase [Firmicutes bacterium]|nr:AAA family ATPase [Bacillota bacterium]
MKTLYLIGGPMGVGKNKVGRALQKKLPACAFLDGDCLWDADPFVVTDETKAMVLDNISFVLNGLLHCTAYENVVFAWVMHEQEIIDSVLGRLDLWLCSDVVCVTLTADEKTLRERLEKDIAAGLRDSSVIERSLDRARAAASLGTAKVDTSGLTPGEAADRVIALAGHIA